MWASHCRRRQQTVILSVMVVVLSVSFGTGRCLAAFESPVSLAPNENKEERLFDRRATDVKDRLPADIDHEVRDGEKQHQDKSGGGAKTAVRRAFSGTSEQDEEQSQKQAAAINAAARKRAVLPVACCG